MAVIWKLLYRRINFVGINRQYNAVVNRLIQIALNLSRYDLLLLSILSTHDVVDTNDIIDVTLISSSIIRIMALQGFFRSVLILKQH